MARGEIPVVVLGSNGPPVVGASIQVNLRNEDGTLGALATVYAAPTGAGTVANPLSSTTDGDAVGWLDGPESYRATITFSTITKIVDFEINPGLDLFSFNITETKGLVYAHHHGVVADNATNNDAGLDASFNALPVAGGSILIPQHDAAAAAVLYNTPKDWTSKPVRIDPMGGGRTRAVDGTTGAPNLHYNGAGGAGTVGMKLGKHGILGAIAYDGGAAEKGISWIVGSSPSAGAEYGADFSKITGGATYSWHVGNGVGVGQFHEVRAYGADSGTLPTTFWLEEDDVWLVGCYLGKGNPCFKLSAGGFVMIGGDISGEVTTANGTKGALWVTKGNHSRFVGTRFGKHYGNGVAGDSAHVTVEGADGNVAFCTFADCQWTNNTGGTNHNKVNALAVIDGASGVDRVVVAGGHVRSFNTTDEYRYALDRQGGTRVVYKPDLVENCATGLWTARPDVVGEFMVARIAAVATQRNSRFARNTTSVGTGAATAETDLQTVTFTRGIIGSGGSIHIHAAGTVTGTNNTKTIKLKLGATTLATISVVAGATPDWMFDAVITSTGTAAQRVIVRAFQGTTVEVVDYLTATEDTVGADIVLKTTGTTPNATDEVTSTMIEARVAS